MTIELVAAGYIYSRAAFAEYAKGASVRASRALSRGVGDTALGGSVAASQPSLASGGRAGRQRRDGHAVEQVLRGVKAASALNCRRSIASAGATRTSEKSGSRHETCVARSDNHV